MVVPFPKITTDGYLRQAAQDTISILTAPPPSTVPSLDRGDDARNCLLKLATWLNRADTLPTPPSIPNTVLPQRVRNKEYIENINSTLVTEAQRVESEIGDSIKLNWKRGQLLQPQKK